MIIWKNIDAVKVVLGLKTYYGYQHSTVSLGVRKEILLA